jgi:hypothetical protein
MVIESESMGKVDMKQIERKNINLRLVSGRGKDASAGNEHFFDEPEFNRMLDLEIKRSQRSMKPLILMSLKLSGMSNPALAPVARTVMNAIVTGIRDTDIRGWYKQDEVVGILFTDMESVSPSVLDILYRRIMTSLAGRMNRTVMLEIKVTFCLYTEGKLQVDAIELATIEHYAALVKNTARLNFSAKLKSLVDVASSFLVT